MASAVVSPVTEESRAAAPIATLGGMQPEVRRKGCSPLAHRRLAKRAGAPGRLALPLLLAAAALDRYHQRWAWRELGWPIDNAEPGGEAKGLRRCSRPQAHWFRTPELLAPTFYPMDDALEDLRSLLDGDEPAVAEPATSADAAEADRTFMRVGTWYQNSVGSLLNHEKEPISVVLHILALDRFQIRVEYLSSPAGPGAGWLEVNGTFQLASVPEEPGRLLAVPKAGGEEEAFMYDTEVLTAATSLALKCLECAKGAAMSALQLKVDTRSDSVLVLPHAALRWVWRDPVTLTRTVPEDLWRGDGA